MKARVSESQSELGLLKFCRLRIPMITTNSVKSHHATQQLRNFTETYPSFTGAAKCHVTRLQSVHMILIWVANRTDTHRDSLNYNDPGYMNRKIECSGRINLIRTTNGNIDSSSCMSQRADVELNESKFRLLRVSNLSVLNFQIFLHMYPRSVTCCTSTT